MLSLASIDHIESCSKSFSDETIKSKLDDISDWLKVKMRTQMSYLATLGLLDKPPGRLIVIKQHQVATSIQDIYCNELLLS